MQNAIYLGMKFKEKKKPPLGFDNSKVQCFIPFLRQQKLHSTNFLKQTGSQRAKALFRPSQNPLEQGPHFDIESQTLTG